MPLRFGCVGKYEGQMWTSNDWQKLIFGQKRLEWVETAPTAYIQTITTEVLPFVDLENLWTGYDKKQCWRVSCKSCAGYVHKCKMLC